MTDAERRLRLTWRRTYPNDPDHRRDFTATDPARPEMFARVYFMGRRAHDPIPADWFWTVADGVQIGLGYADTSREAAQAAEDAHAAWLAEHNK